MLLNAAFNEMIGIGAWRGRTEKAGPFWYFQNGKLVSDETPGPAVRVTSTGGWVTVTVTDTPDTFIEAPSVTV